MDSLERLAHSLEQAVALIHSLRRENRDLARLAAEAKSAASRLGELEGLKAGFDEAKIEIERLRQEPAVDLEAMERARQAELEAARLAEDLDSERQRRLEEKRDWELKLHALELKLLEAQREETMPLPLPDRRPEVESLSRRCAELEIMLSEAQAGLEKSRGDITALQVRIAESADPEEVSTWQQRIHELGSELEGLRQLSGMKERLDADKAEVRKQKRTLAAIAAEREMTRKKLDEIYASLENLRLG